MKFEVYLNCCLALGCWYTVVGFQINGVVTFNANEKDDVIRQRNYVGMWNKTIKQEVKLSSVVCLFEWFKSIGVFCILEILIIQKAKFRSLSPFRISYHRCVSSRFWYT